MSAKRRIIPVFVPHLGCPNDCVFCNQRRISGAAEPANAETVRNAIVSAGVESGDCTQWELAFYGGSFTAIDDNVRSELLSAAEDFVKRTGCDSLAIAIGTSHGAYKFKGEAKLRFDILKEIKKSIPNTPIVLHGASTVIPELVDMCNKYGGQIPGTKGVPDEILKEASKLGVSKINVDTDLRLAMTAGIRKILYEKLGEFDPRKYLSEARSLIKETVKYKMINVFGSNNKI